MAWTWRLVHTILPHQFVSDNAVLAAVARFGVCVCAALRRRLTAAIHDFQGAAAQYEEVIKHGLDLEAVVKCRQLGVYEPLGVPVTAQGAKANLQRLVWRYRCSVEVSQTSLSQALSDRQSDRQCHACANTCSIRH